MIDHWGKKEIEKDTKRFIDFPCMWIHWFDFVKMVTSSKAMYRFHATCLKVPIIFSEIEK